MIIELNMKDIIKAKPKIGEILNRILLIVRLIACQQRFFLCKLLPKILVL